MCFGVVGHSAFWQRMLEFQRKILRSLTLHWIRLAPVTTEALVICIALFGCCVIQAVVDGAEMADIQREWGAVRQLSRAEAFDGVRRDKEIVLNGPFDVWEGAWFRIPLTVFHHRNLMHLTVVIAATLYLGSLLEQKWGSLYFGLFLVPAMTVPIISELDFGNAAMGFSGTVFALLGALSVLRLSDARLASRLPLESILFGMAVIVLGVLATLSGFVEVANISHVSGFIYGVIVATCSAQKSRLLRISMILSHLWLIPALFLATHPTWIGRYHWYRATRIPSAVFAEKSLKRAVECDPSLTGVWLRLAKVAEEKQDPIEAWKRLMSGMEINPCSAPLMDATRRLWRHLDFVQRNEAETHLRQVFGSKASAWLRSIRASFESHKSSVIEENSVPSEIIDLSGIALDQKVELPLLDLGNGLRNPLPMREPENLNDAAEGQRL
jgi:membrane associated rhomboid family serine protease